MYQHHHSKEHFPKSHYASYYQVKDDVLGQQNQEKKIQKKHSHHQKENVTSNDHQFISINHHDFNKDFSHTNKHFDHEESKHKILPHNNTQHHKKQHETSIKIEKNTKSRKNSFVDENKIKKEKYQKYIDENAMLKEENVELKQKLVSFKEILEKEIKRSNLSRKEIYFYQQKKNLQSELKKFKEEYSILNLQFTDNEKQLIEANLKIGSLESQVNELNELISNLQPKNEILQNGDERIKQFNEKTTNFYDEKHLVDELRSQVQTLTEENLKIQKLNEEILLQNQILIDDKKKEDFQNLFLQLENTKKELSKIPSLTQEISKCQLELSKSQSKIFSLERINQSLKEKNNELQSENDAIKNQLKEAEDLLSVSNTTNDALNKKLNNLAQENEKLKEETNQTKLLANTNDSESDLIKKNHQLQNQIEELSQKNEELFRQNEELRWFNANLSQRNLDCELGKAKQKSVRSEEK